MTRPATDTGEAPGSSPHRSSTGSLTVLAIVATVILWASAFVAIRAALASYSPSHLAVFRFAIASVVLGALIFRGGMSLPSRGELPRIIAIGAIGITGYNLALNFGEQRVTAASASFIVNTVPIITALFALVAGLDKLSAKGWLGSLVSLAGVCLVAIGEEGGLTLSMGTALVLLAALCQSAFFVLQKPLLTKYGSVRVMSWAIWIGMLLLLPLGRGLVDTIRTVPFEGTLSVVYLGVFPGALGYVTWAYALKHLPVARACTFLFAVPPTTMLIGWCWLGEIPGWLAISGGVLALSGVAIVNASPRR